MTARTIQRAFTLIEVLIAVLVLALGVLGLAAVFSVGIPQQRIAADQIQGLNVLDSARATLLGSERLNNPRERFGVGDLTVRPRGWSVLQQRIDPSNLFDPDDTWSPRGEWILPARDRNDAQDGGWIYLDPYAEAGDKDAGEIVIVSPSLLQEYDVRIGIEQRLSPAPYTGRGEPQYVWDFIARRVPGGEVDLNTGLVRPTKRDQIEIAVFVRRVDPGIRVQLTRREEPDSRVRYGPRLRLSDYLTMNALEITGDIDGEINEAQRVVPVSSNIDTSQPRQDGRTLSAGNQLGEYALPFGIGVADVGQYPGGGGGPGDGGSAVIPRDRLPLEPGGSGSADDDIRFRLATQLGQRLLDRFGNVYEIRGVDEELTEQLGVTVVRIVPPAPSDLAAPAGFRYPNRSDLDGQAFITTPQIPVAVDVFRVSP